MVKFPTHKSIVEPHIICLSNVSHFPLRPHHFGSKIMSNDMPTISLDTSYVFVVQESDLEHAKSNKTKQNFDLNLDFGLSDDLTGIVSRCT